MYRIMQSLCIILCIAAPRGELHTSAVYCVSTATCFQPRWLRPAKLQHSRRAARRGHSVQNVRWSPSCLQSWHQHLSPAPRPPSGVDCKWTVLERHCLVGVLLQNGDMCDRCRSRTEQPRDRQPSNRRRHARHLLLHLALALGWRVHGGKTE